VFLFRSERSLLPYPNGSPRRKIRRLKPVTSPHRIAWLCFLHPFPSLRLANRFRLPDPRLRTSDHPRGGHFFFSWFGDTIRILGGTLGDSSSPALPAYFFFTAKPLASPSAIFWFFENFPYIGTYMADARTSALSL